MRTLEFIGTLQSNLGEFSQTMVIPGRKALVLAHEDWPLKLEPGTLNVAINDDGFPAALEQLGNAEGLKKLDEGNFRCAMAIPPWRIEGNTLQPTADELPRGGAMLWRAELHAVSTGETAACWMLRRQGSAIVSQIELVSHENLRSRLNLSDGSVVKVTIWEADQPDPPSPSDAIAAWCEAVSGRIEPVFGRKKAMGYLIGEKFLAFLAVAETNAEWRDAIPEFVGAIKSLFEPWQIAQFLKTPRRLGPLGHTASKKVHQMYRDAMEESERVEEDARNLMLLSWAEELLLED